MNDLLLASARQPALRRVLSGLSVPLPPLLPRERGPWSERLLEGQRVLFVGSATAIVRSLLLAGATLEASSKATLSTCAEWSEAFARPITDAGTERLDAIVFDATAIVAAPDFGRLHEGIAGSLPRLRAGGRVVLVSRAETVGAHAVLGFTKSLAKELGRRGGRANVVEVREGAEGWSGAAVVFLASKRSAFVDGQVVPVRSGEGTPAVLGARSLRGRSAVVTGAARGIGRATALALAGEGARVVCVDREDAARETSQLAREIGGVPALVDVTAERAGAVIEAALRGERADVLVHNAGVTRDKTLARMKREDFDLAVAVSLTAPLAITEHLAAHEKLGARVVFLSSIAGIAGNVGQTNHAAAKAGVIGAVHALSARWAGKTTVNAVAPGFIETDMTAKVPLFIREAGRRLSSLSQGGVPDDVAQAVLFLSHPAAAGVTSSVLRVCGQSLLGA